MSIFVLVILILVILIALAFIFRAIAQYQRKSFLNRTFVDDLVLPNNRSQFFDSAEGKIHYIVEGKGPLIVLVHGIGANVYCWRRLIPILAERFRVCAMDIPGFGASAKPQHGYSVQDQARRLLTLLDHLNIQSCFILGSSLGGAIVCEMVTQKPELFSKVILISPAHDAKTSPIDLSFLRHISHFSAPLLTPALMKHILKSIYGYDYAKMVNDSMISGYLRPYIEDPRTLHSFFASFKTIQDASLADRYAKLKKETLILWGDQDRIIPTGFGEKFLKSLTKSKLVIHSGGGHHLQEEDPLWIWNQIQNFIN